jgi:hypothetical protein
MSGYQVKIETLPSNCEDCLLRDQGCDNNKRQGCFEFINSNVDSIGSINTSHILPKVLKKAVKFLRMECSKFTKTD